jgi:hypothetical protein
LDGSDLGLQSIDIKIFSVEKVFCFLDKRERGWSYTDQPLFELNNLNIH